MKKALSILLALIAVASLAAPMASAEQEISFAAPAVQGTLIPASATLYVDPAEGPTSVLVSLPGTFTHAAGCTGPTTPGTDNYFFWRYTPEYMQFDNYVTYRPERLLSPGSGELSNHTLTPAEKMTLAVVSGLQIDEEVTVDICAQCIYCDNAYKITITIIPKKAVVPPEQDLLSILKTWWNDLKITWHEQIHPFLKYIYFNTWGWIVSAWNKLVDAIVGLFK